MEVDQIPILRREDLKPQYKDATIKTITKNTSVAFTPFIFQKMHRFNIILFIDNNGDIFILKNRYGRNSLQYMEWLFKQNEALTHRYIEAENFIRNLANNRWRIFGLKKKCRKFLKNAIRKHGIHGF